MAIKSSKVEALIESAFHRKPAVSMLLSVFNPSVIKGRCVRSSERLFLAKIGDGTTPAYEVQTLTHEVHRGTLLDIVGCRIYQIPLTISIMVTPL
jgi:hypothetical protein